MNYTIWNENIITNFEKQNVNNIDTVDLLTLLWNYRIKNKNITDKVHKIVHELLKRQMRHSLWGGWGELLIIINSIYNKDAFEYIYVVKEVKKSLENVIKENDFHTYDFVNGYVGNLHALLVTHNLSDNDTKIINNNLIIPFYKIIRNRNIYDFGFAHGLAGVLGVLKEYYIVNNNRKINDLITQIKQYIYSKCCFSFDRLMFCNTKEKDKSILNSSVNFSWCYGNVVLSNLIDDTNLDRLLRDKKNLIQREFVIWSKNKKIITCHGIMGPFLFFTFKKDNKDLINLIRNIGIKKIMHFVDYFPLENVISDEDIHPYSEFDGTTSTIMFLYAIYNQDISIVEEYANLFGLGI